MSTLRNAAAVLRGLSTESPEASVTDVATRLGLPKSTTSRLLKMMAEEGLLEPAGVSRGYRVGPLVVGAGRLFRVGSGLIQALNDTIVRIVDEVGHNGYVSVRDGREIFAIRTATAGHGLKVVTPIGRRFPASATAVGRALLARLRDRQVADLYRAALPRPSKNAPATLDELLARLAQVRRERLARADDEANRGVGTIAVAVSDPETQESAAACITFSLALVSREERERISTLLLSGAEQIGQRFGDPVWMAADEKVARPARRTA